MIIAILARMFRLSALVRENSFDEKYLNYKIEVVQIYSSRGYITQALIIMGLLSYIYSNQIRLLVFAFTVASTYQQFKSLYKVFVS